MSNLRRRVLGDTTGKGSNGERASTQAFLHALRAQRHKCGGADRER